MKQLSTILSLLFLSVVAFAQAPSIPIDFESTTLTYTFADFAGGVAAVIDNPDASGINTSGKVVELVKFEGEVYGGSTLALAGPIDFGTNNAVKMKVWANRVGASVLFKLEGTSPVEVFATTTVANQWEELTFSFAGLTSLNFTGITFIYDLGVVGDGSADFTMYFDDIELTTAMGGVQVPVDFESTTLTYAFADFAGGVASVIDNPDASGINASGKVGQMVKFAGEVFGGSTLALGGAIDFGANNAIKMKVWTNRANAPVLFKLEGPAPVEVTARTTGANAWEELTFGFAGLTEGVYTGITIIYDLGVVGDGGANFTMYFDDIDFTTVTGGVQLPIDFESTTLSYTFSDFAGGVGAVIDNPASTTSNPSGKVVQMIKFAGEVYGGSTLALGGPIVFGSNTSVEMKVLANRVGAPMLFKLEGPAPVEVSASTTVAGEWETLTYDLSGLTGGVYTGITLIYDLGVVGDGGENFTILLDDIRFPGSVSVVDLPALDVTYYPNPAQDFMIVKAQENMEAIRIFNLNGQQVYFEKMDSNQQTVDLSALAPGAYFIKVQIGNQEGVAKLIKN